MWTTERENFSNTSIVVCSSAPSLSSGRCAIGRGSTVTVRSAGVRCWHDGEHQRPGDDEEQDRQDLGQGPTRWHDADCGSRLTG